MERILGDVNCEGHACRAVKEGGNPEGESRPLQIAGRGRRGRGTGRGRWEHTILQRGEAGRLLAQRGHGAEEGVDLFLEVSNVVGHLPELVRVLEIGAAVWRIEALEVEMAAPLAGRLAIAFDLAALALVAAAGESTVRIVCLVTCVCLARSRLDEEASCVGRLGGASMV